MPLYFSLGNIMNAGLVLVMNDLNTSFPTAYSMLTTQFVCDGLCDKIGKGQKRQQL